MLTRQDEIIANYLIEKRFNYVDKDKRTPITHNEIAQHLCEYYPEIFEGIAKNDLVFRHVSEWVENASYHSFTELAEDILADETPQTFEAVLASNYGYDSFNELELDYTVIYDNAIDGYLVF